MKNANHNNKRIVVESSTLNKRINHTPKNEMNRSTIEQIIQWPLEACPIQKAVLEYGKRTAMLGSKHALSTLEKYHSLLLKVKSAHDLDKIIYDLCDDIKKIKMEFHALYDDE